jgi:Leucine-rich repeat (LRR) protein
LNLSNKNLGDKEIKDGKDALSELVALDTLDLSGNRLTKFPDLTFSDCRVLNITHNNLEPFPDIAKTSWTLEEIDIRGNPALNINDRFKLRELVPKLKILDGEDVPENDVFFTIKKTLTRELGKLAADKFKDELTEKSGQEKFLKRARRVPAGPKRYNFGQFSHYWSILVIYKFIWSFWLFYGTFLLTFGSFWPVYCQFRLFFGQSY